MMSGIAGIWRPGGFGRSPVAVVEPAETLQRMLCAMADGETEGQAVWLSPAGCALGQLQAGDEESQPIANEDGTLWLVAAGTLRNVAPLRAELAKRHLFRTESDLELLLHLVEEVGPDGLELVEGEFTCALWGPGRELILHRDPMGLMPLYYGRDGAGNLLFASAVPSLAPEVEWIDQVPAGAHFTARPPRLVAGFH
jgi:asparagine synthase (glutamine-hydrolysing)